MPRYGWRPVAEDCISLDINRWVKEGAIGAYKHVTGGWKWTWNVNGEERSSIGYETNTMNPHAPWIRLCYRVKGEEESIDYKIELTTTPVHFGGERWWFVCPLCRNGRRCNRRVGKLYLPAGGKYFGCRQCYNLTYTSCNDSHRFDGLFRLMGAQMGLTANEVKKILGGK